MIPPPPSSTLFPYTTLFRSIHKAGRDFLEVVREICEIVEGPVSAEVVALDFEGMMREAEIVRKIADNVDRKSTRLNSSHVKISYAVFCLKKKKKKQEKNQKR